MTEVAIWLGIATACLLFPWASIQYRKMAWGYLFVLQDQYMAAFGGMTVLEIARNGSVAVSSAHVSATVIDDLQRNMLLFYTGVERSSNDILARQNSGVNAADPTVLGSLHRIKEMGLAIREMVESGDLTSFGLELDRHWQEKRRLAAGITNHRFDQIYAIAKENGALGGKISGAGGGGFFLFYTETRHAQLRQAMRDVGLREMRYRFEFEGSKVLFNVMDASYPPSIADLTATAAA